MPGKNIEIKHSVGQARPLSVPFLFRTSGKGDSHSQAGSTTANQDIHLMDPDFVLWLLCIHAYSVREGIGIYRVQYETEYTMIKTICQQSG